MADEEDLAYLQKGFDPASLTVPRLRNVLLTHGISFPSSAKKADLVQLFNDELKPRAAKILSARRRTQRSSKGIEDAPSSMASSIDATEEEEVAAPPAPATVKKPRGRAKKSAVAEDSETTLVPATITKSARSKSRGKSKTVEPAITPAPKKEPSDPATWLDYSNDSPFSKENPFQSGSSPIAAPTTASKRRKTEGVDVKETKKWPSAATRRKTEQTPSTEKVVKKRTTTIPVDEIASQDVDISEEFTPEEQQELEVERRKGNLAVLPVRRTGTRSDGISWKSPIVAILLVMLSGIGGVWRQEKFNVGYCGIGQPSDALYGVDIPEWAEPIRPQCEQCPQHAICREQLNTECENGFVLQHNVLSLNGLLPFVPSCEADGEKAKRVKAVADRIEDELRSRRAAVECSSVDESGKPITSSEIPEEVLKAYVSAKRRKGMSDQEFNNLFEDAIPELSGRDEIVVTMDE
jgi:Man1-Src1p-C-terminal domain/HeH/LEM domain